LAVRRCDHRRCAVSAGGRYEERLSDRSGRRRDPGGSLDNYVMSFVGEHKGALIGSTVLHGVFVLALAVGVRLPASERAPVAVTATPIEGVIIDEAALQREVQKREEAARQERLRREREERQRREAAERQERERVEAQ